MSLGEGQTFAGYTVVRRLGAGGMGEVYLAQHPRLPRRDALKLLASAISSDANFRERFLREADLASTLWHPHIVGVHDRGEDDGRLWISMDFVDGEDAGSLLARRYPEGMPPELVVSIVTAVASALDHAHERSLLHRDVKPANIMLTNVEDGGEPRILLTDFGIARTVDDDSGLTATNMTIGTVAYTSPEQLMGEDVDGRADQYSLASTAYQLLTGASLFAHTNAAVVISRHLSSPPPALADVRPELATLDAVLSKALAKDPGGRFATCSAFARALADPSALETPAPVSFAKAPAQVITGAPPASAGSEAPTSLVATTPPVRRIPTEPPAPTPVAPVVLSPGWYQDPSGRGGSRYWDGQGWHAPAAPPPQSGSRNGPLLAVLGVAVAVVLIGALVYLFGRDDGSAPPTASGPSTSRTPVTTTSYRPSDDVVTDSPVYRPPPPPPPPETATSMIVGTCDEGGSCGVKQRNAPFVAAPRLYPNDLKDGATVTMVCQTSGDVRSSEGHGSSTTWYRLDNGAYVNAVYLSNPAEVPQC